MPTLITDLRQRAEAVLAQRARQTPEEFAALSPDTVQQMLHELRVHQIQLEMQNEELRQIQAELNQSRASYFDLYELAPIGYCTLSESGLIRRANLRTAAMLGVARSDLSKRALANFVRAGDQHIFADWRQRIVSTNASQECELRLIQRDGAELWVLLQSQAIAAGRAEGQMHLVLHDITGQKQVEKELLAVSTQLAHLSSQKEKQGVELSIASLKLGQQSEENERWATELLGNLGKALDGLHIALCVFDDHDNTILWNNEFFTVFPEHSGKVFKGEPYAENLRRFYMGRLGEAELPNVDLYVDAGIARHREQNRPFSFEHHGRHIDASSIRLSGDKRVRVWRMRDSAMYPSPLLPASVPPTSESPSSSDSSLFDRLPDGLMTCNQDGLVMRVNDSFLKIYELPDREAAVNHSFEFIFRLVWDGRTHDDASVALRESGVRTLRENMRFSGAPFELALPGGRYVRISARATEDRETFYAHVDISELKLREQFQNQKQDRLMRQSKLELNLAQAVFESQEGLFTTDAKKVILKVNTAFTVITGYSAEDAVGQTPRLLSSGRHDHSFYALMWESIIRTGTWQGEIWNRRKDGVVYPETLRISAVRDSAGEVNNYVAVFNDATKHKVAEERMRSLAFSDPLTGLPNRQQLIVLLQEGQLARTQRPRQDALLLVDLDKFKDLNTTIGRENGDLLLQNVAHRLGNCIRKCDTLVRLGGNAFVVMLQDLSLIPPQAASEVEVVAGKLLLALNKPYRIGNSDIHCSASIGIAFVDGAAQDIEAPLNQAELALNYAKSGGRNAMRFFDPQMRLDVSARVAMESDLRDALLSDQFALYYQPQLSRQGRIIGAEALLRWQHPLSGTVSPADFIPVAEESGLILPIGQWALETACRQLAVWAGQAHMAKLTVAVNVSAHQLHQTDFVDQVLAVLERSGADPHRLKLELTESALVTNVESITTKMNALKAIGVSFSLDDFGTGYSSLSYLKRLPLDQLKIDQSFVRNIVTDPGDAAIAKTVIALADSMGLSVIAEGVELEAQRNLLTDLGCHNYQGYLFSRPLPVHEFEAFVAQA